MTVTKIKANVRIEKDFLGERENKLLAETLMNDSMCRLFGSKKIIFVKSDSHEFPNE